MQAIGRKISAKRKERDMTQVDLADKLGVTYQAVSSWERGHSMPDIAKLPDISQVLAVSIDELLDNTATATLVKSVLTGQKPQVPDLEALVDAAPILKPSQIETLTTGKAIANEKFLVEMACHLESEKIREIVLACDGLSGRAIADLACYMESEDLREIILHCKNIDMKTITKIAVHLEEDDLAEIIMNAMQNVKGNS